MLSKYQVRLPGPTPNGSHDMLNTHPPRLHADKLMPTHTDTHTHTHTNTHTHTMATHTHTHTHTHKHTHTRTHAHAHAGTHRLIRTVTDWDTYKRNT